MFWALHGNMLWQYEGCWESHAVPAVPPSLGTCALSSYIAMLHCRQDVANAAYCIVLKCAAHCDFASAL